MAERVYTIHAQVMQQNHFLQVIWGLSFQIECRESSIPVTFWTAFMCFDPYVAIKDQWKAALGYRSALQ